ncbi:hypothetical protein OESDEN_09893 [Oesophagostomum dentatum]|uniref:7TM GPCR serpentine receptor class x (Srx) domain-containing protein n=1 Tax=Oesophagostomum dentatum TaxID=61180 RepID=A0A0B1T292_OESDE|nr:hypothetical protein OESDEN_09893 [Oesophagostomum dentatum]
MWTYADTECGYTLSLFDLYSFSTLAAAMLLINIATFIKLRMVHRNSIKNSGNVANGFDAKRRLEIRFFVQVVLEYIAILYIMITSCFISRIFSGQWWLYLTVTLPMPAFHAVDGSLPCSLPTS